MVLAALPGLSLSGTAQNKAPRWVPLALSISGVFALWGFGATRLAGPTPADLPDVRLRLVQANIPQALKWDPAQRESILARYIALSTRPGSTRPTLIIWPESAVPFFIAEDAGSHDLVV